MMASKRGKTTSRELVCSKCDSSLDGNQLFCYECGEPTKVLRKELSAVNNIKETWSNYKERKGQNFPFAIFFFFALIVPLGLIVYYTHHDYWLHTLSLLVFLPLMFVPFAINVWKDQEVLAVKKYPACLKKYFRFLIFIVINVLFFAVLKIITTSVDPILNIVRLILVLYWLAIIVPYPHLLANKDIDPYRGWLKVFKGGKETRWQQFYTLLFLFVINVLGLALAGIGLLITIPFSIAVLERYYRQMDKYGLFD
jgi:hypothetical protein